jgi:hypothetical protein
MSDRIEEIKERVDKATPGPWVSECEVGETFIWNANKTGWRGPGPALVVDDEYISPENADFIAHSRDDIPYLLTRLASVEAENREHVLRADSLRAEIERLNEEENEWSEKWDEMVARLAHLEALLSRERLDELIGELFKKPGPLNPDAYFITRDIGIRRAGALALRDAIRKEAE